MPLVYGHVGLVIISDIFYLIIFFSSFTKEVCCTEMQLFGSYKYFLTAKVVCVSAQLLRALSLPISFQGLVDGIKSALSKRKEDEELGTELTRIDIIKCIQSERVRFRGINLSGLDLSKLVIIQCQTISFLFVLSCRYGYLIQTSCITILLS